MTGEARERAAWRAAAAGVGLVAFLPFVRGVASGQAFFFRDISRYFFPLRAFIAARMRAGEIPFWNPYNHEGIPQPVSPLGYPVELLQVLSPKDPAWFSLLLALHVPLAAWGCLWLAKRLGLSPLAAAGAALTYALGGFCLSMLNFYIYLHAMAWAPFAIAASLDAARGGGRWFALAALAWGMLFSTSGVEIVLQAALVAAVLAWDRADRRAIPRLAAAGLVGMALAAPVLLIVGGAVGGSERAQGFAVETVLNQSIHPFTFLQVVVGDLYGDLSRGVNRWWGGNFFEGFSYVLSLYLGASVAALAAGGAAGVRGPRLRLLALVVLGVAVGLGRWGGWTGIVEALPASWRVFRFPTKAFFTVHLAAALLAGFGIAAVTEGVRRAQRTAAAAALAAAALLTALPVLPDLSPDAASWFLAHFFPPELSPAAAAPLLDHILADAARGGVLAAATGLAVLFALGGRIPGRSAAALCVAVLAADLLRTGAGLNPMTGAAFARLSPEGRALLGAVRPVRLYTCEPSSAGSYWRGRRLRREHDAFTFAVWRETLAPNYNLEVPVPTALSENLTSLVPADRLLPENASCARFGEIAERLREGAVSHVVALDPIRSPDLALVGTAAIPVLAPVRVHFYALAGARPRFELVDADGRVDGSAVELRSESADALSLATVSPRPATLVVRDGYAEGWTARVDGRPAPLTLHPPRYRAVAVPAGTSVVALQYRPPRLGRGLLVALAAAAIVAWCWRRGDARPSGEAA